MFYREEDISSELLCPKCEKRFNDPRILLCGHSFCHDCIQRLVSNKLVKCTVCNKKHAVEVDASGDVEFVKNEFISTLLEKKAFEVRRGNKSDLLKQAVNNLNEKRKELTILSKLEDCEMNVHDYVSSLRSQIDIISETQIELLNQARESLLKELVGYFNDCFSEISKIVKEDSQFLKEIDSLCQDIAQYVSQPDLDESVVEGKTEVVKKMATTCSQKITSFQDRIFMNRKPIFEESKVKATAVLIGLLNFGNISKNPFNTRIASSSPIQSKTLWREDFDKSTWEPNVLEQSLWDN